jgi:hypothetical protein
MLRRVVLTRATRRNIPEDTILHSHRHENFKSSTLEDLRSTDLPAGGSSYSAYKGFYLNRGQYAGA